MTAKPTLPFKIESLDGLGQGVSKIDGKITFIQKTLPGEEGVARIVAKKKDVSFAELVSLKSPSPQRIEPVCPHFSNCPSCHFLHTDYQMELDQKKKSLERILRNLAHPELKVFGAHQRLGYRNRIQLHYDTKTRSLGMLNLNQRRIIPVPQCLMGLPEVAAELRRLYQDEKWLKEAPKKPEQGHVEIYFKEGDLQVTWNRPYAEGGFTQVYQEMNQSLLQELENWRKDKKPTDLLDLFAGNGNLTTRLPFHKRLCVDIYQNLPGEGFVSQELYHPQALKSIQRQIQQRGMNPRLLVLDPPRSGLKNLNEWLSAFGLDEVAYVSCDPHTLARDLREVKNYRISDAFLFDFFPATFHFETMIFLERNT